MPRRAKNNKKTAGSADRAITNNQGKRNPGGARVSVTRVRATGGVADTARVTLRYTQEVLMTSTSGAYVSNVYRGNGPFDPDQTGTGAQPVWYDDYSAMYNRYRCTGSRIAVTWFQNEASSISLIAGVTPQHQTTSMATVTFAYAQPYTETVGVSAYTQGRVTQQMIGTAKYLGYPGAGMMGSDALESLYSTVPAHQWYWHVWARATDTSTTVAARTIVTIDYDILWFDKVDGALNLEFRRLNFMKAGRVTVVPEVKDVKEAISVMLGTAEKASADRPVLPGVRDLGDRKADVLAERWSWSEEDDDDDESMYAKFLAWKSQVADKPMRRVAAVAGQVAAALPAGAALATVALARGLPTLVYGGSTAAVATTNSTPPSSVGPSGTTRSSSAKGTTSSSLAGQPGAGLKDAS